MAEGDERNEADPNAQPVPAPPADTGGPDPNAQPAPGPPGDTGGPRRLPPALRFILSMIGVPVGAAIMIATTAAMPGNSIALGFVGAAILAIAVIVSAFARHDHATGAGAIVGVALAFIVPFACFAMIGGIGR